MGRKDQLSDYEKGKIDALHNEEKKVAYIAREIQRSRHVVQNYLND